MNASQHSTHKRISLCLAQFISFHELHSFLLSCFFFLGYLSQHVLSVYTRVSVDMKKKRKLSTSVVVSGRSIEVIALQSVISWMGSVVPIFTCVFERKTSIKMTVFSLVPFPFTISVGIFLDLPGRAECVGFHFKQGSHVHHITRGLS